MNKILACIECEKNAKAICDGALFFAKHFDAQIVLFHALKNETYEINFSSNLALNTSNTLMQKVLEDDEDIKKEQLLKSQELLLKYQEYCLDNGIITDIVNLQGDFEKLVKQESKKYKLVILGRLGEQGDSLSVKHLLKSLDTPMFLVDDEFCSIKSVLFAYDGNQMLTKALDKNLSEPIFKSVKRVVVTLSEDETKAQKNLAQARDLFLKYGISVDAIHIKEQNVNALLEYANANDIDVLAMGAYSNSVLKHLIFGSFTNEIINKSKKQLLIFK